VSLSRAATVIGGLGLAAAVCACWEVTRPSLPITPLPPEPVASGTLPASASALEEIDEAPAAQPYAAAPPLEVGPQVQVSEAVGTTPGAVGAMVAPLIEPLARCDVKTKGKLVVRVIAEKERTHFRVVDPGDLASEAKTCALEALSTMEVDSAVQGSLSPSDAPPHMETQLVISW
jgi:hypothetical protein